METVGAYLKKERESKNISLGELSRSTKISELYLEYIEKDEFDKLPQGPYVKGYIVSYSRLIGGNVDEALKLYEILNRKKTEAESIQPEIAKQIVKDDLPEKPKTKARKKPKSALSGKVKSLIDTVASSVKVSSASFKTAGTSIKTIGSSIRKNSNGFEIIVSYVKKMALSRSWLYAFIALIGTGILVFAGFGFYHLFIYDPKPVSVAESQQVIEKEKRSLTAMGSGKSVLPSKSTDVSSTTDQLERQVNDKERSEPPNQAEDQKRSSSLSTNPDPVAPRTKLKPEHSTGTSAIDTQTNMPLSGSSTTAKDTVSNPIVAGKESLVLSDQKQIIPDPSPESAAVDADLTVLQASICSEIENRMPAGVDTSFPISIQRVYVWNAIEAKQIPSTIRHIYYFKGQVVSDVALDVGSTYWRTWSTKSISDDSDRGEWRVDIASVDGKVLRRLYFEIR